jgi:hypothetical protein
VRSLTLKISFALICISSLSHARNLLEITL